jgi:hypothetical protein
VSEPINIHVGVGTIVLDFDKVPDGWQVIDCWLDDTGEGMHLLFGPPPDEEE